MKIAIITDQHFGARNDSQHFLDYYEKFYSEVFFPQIDSNGINNVLILGDTFDRRKYVNFYSLKRTKEMFFDELANRNIKVNMLAGNHDTYFKNTNEVNSVDLLLREYNNITVIDTPHTIYIGGTAICMMPWICPDNHQESMDQLKQTEADICMGHFEIAGFAMHRGMPSNEGLERDLFSKFDMVFSGHYHHRSSQGNIHYLGNPYELTWQDYNDARGFHIFDTETYELEAVDNPFSLYEIIYYNDTPRQLVKFTDYTNKIVKVVVKQKSNEKEYDRFLDALMKVNPYDVKIVEKVDNISFDDEIVNQTEDTMTLLDKYVDDLETDLNKSKIKSLIKNIYQEACEVM